MEDEKIKQLYSLLEQIPVTDENEETIDDIKVALLKKQYTEALEKIKNLSSEQNKINKRKAKKENEQNDDGKLYPNKLSNSNLEQIYMGLMLNHPKYIVKYYILHDDCYFEDPAILNIYKSILFTEGSAYAPEVAKAGFNFSKYSEEVNRFKAELRKKASEKNYDMEKIYLELRKLFILRKQYIEMPVSSIQDKIVEITDYELYDQMSEDEIKNAITQVSVTEKFKQTILTQDLTEFLEEGDNNLTNGLELPFPTLTEVFKGIRKGETMAFAMPSNAGKSRFTMNLAAYTSLIHKKKVLVISNEMSEEKMKLCLITTILNNAKIQQMHGQKLSKTEGELLEFKFRPDNKKDTEVDEDGFIIKGEKESQKAFVKRLSEISTEFKQTVLAMDWVNEQMKNSIYFINITDHTNDELRKVIMNYYYKEKIEYIFYDTLKADTANIGNGEELKKTATILSNLAQNFNLFICSTLQLQESSTPPLNLDINDLAVSRTVKEVLDTLCLVKQINNDTLDNYEYSLEEVDTKFYNIEKSKDPDVRYYACVVDKNRAGAKPRLLFKLNLAYNYWEELGYLRLKQ